MANVDVNEAPGGNVMAYEDESGKQPSTLNFSKCHNDIIKQIKAGISVARI